MTFSMTTYIRLYTGRAGWHSRAKQGRSDGGVYLYLYPPKSAQVNFLWAKNDVRTAIQQFYTPKELLYPPPKKKQISGYTPGAKICLGRPRTMEQSSVAPERR